MIRRVLPLLLIFAVGCSRSRTTVKYFSGEPVEHWLTAVNHKDPKVRKKAADVLGNIGPAHQEAIPALITAVKDPDASVRDAAVLALSKNGRAATGAIPALEEACKDRDANVRTHAASALARVRGSP